MGSEGMPPIEKLDNEELTSESINRAFEAGTPIRVKVRRSSGEVEDDWFANAVDPDSNVVLLYKKREGEKDLMKSVPLADLQEWNREGVSEAMPLAVKESANVDGNENLKKNVNALIEFFQLDEKEGKYDSNDKNVIEIGRIIQMHTESVDRGFNRIGDPEAFLADLDAAREKALDVARNDQEKGRIREMFGRLEIR